MCGEVQDKTVGIERQTAACEVEAAAKEAHGQILVLLGVPDVLVDPVADAKELGHVRRNRGMSTHLQSHPLRQSNFYLHACPLAYFLDPP